VKHPGLVAVLSSLALLSGGLSRAQSAPDAKVAEAAFAAHETLKRLDAALTPLKGDDYEKKDRRALIPVLTLLQKQIDAAKPPVEDAPRTTAWRKLQNAVAETERREDEFWAGLPNPDAPVKLPAATVAPLLRQTGEIRASFAGLYPEILAAGRTLSGGRAADGTLPLSPQAAAAAAAAARDAARGRAAGAHPEQFFDGIGARSGLTIEPAPGASADTAARPLARLQSASAEANLPVEPVAHLKVGEVPTFVPVAEEVRRPRSSSAVAALRETAPEALRDAVRASPVVTAAARALPPKASSPAPKPAAAPTAQAAPESAETRACLEAVKDHSSVAGLCKSSPTVAPLLAGLLEALQEQFGTVQGVVMNLAFMLLGLVLSALSGVGVIAKIVVGLASLVMLAGTLWPLIKQLGSAVSDLWNTKAGDLRHSQALVTTGKTGGTVLILALMAVLGGKLGKSGPGKQLTGEMTSGMSSAIKGVGVDMAALDAKIPASIRSFFGGAKPAPASETPESIARSAKSRAQFSEDAVVRNSEIEGREARVKAAMEQLGVDRSFAEKIAQAHDEVPCAVGDCTPAQLRAKLEIMGPGPEADAAIRSGLAGQPRLTLKSRVIKDFVEKYNPEYVKDTILAGEDRGPNPNKKAAGYNHIDENHGPDVSIWLADEKPGWESLERRMNTSNFRIVTKFARNAERNAAVAELRRLIMSNVENGAVRTAVPTVDPHVYYRPASYYSLLQYLVSGPNKEINVRFKMEKPIGVGLERTPAGGLVVRPGLHWAKATLRYSNEKGITIKSIFPAEDTDR
jgi:hypothetical protein